MRGAALFTCVLIASCGSVPSAPDEPPPETIDQPAVTITITRNWVDENGELADTEVVTDVVATDIVAWIPAAGAIGGFDKRTAEKTSTGLVIRDIPTGTTYYLDVESSGFHQLFVTDLREIDVQFYSIERRDAVQTTKPTMLTLNVANLTAWQDEDWLELHCANVDAFGGLRATTPHVRGWPVAGARGLAVTLDWSQVDRGFCGTRPTPLIDGARGDSLVISHMRRIGSSTQFPYETAIETAAFPAFSQVDGGTVTLDTAFPASPPVKDAMHFVVRRPEFERHADDLHPDATIVPTFLGGGGVSVRAQPHDPRHERQISLFAPSMLFTLFGADSSNLDMGLMTYPRPRTGWSQWLAADHNFQVVRDTPFGIEHTAFGSLRVAAKVTPASAPTDVVTPIVPRISPPRSPMINNLSFHLPQTMEMRTTGAPITVTWNAPALIEAPPTVYSLSIFQVTRVGDELRDARVAVISRPPADRSLSIPWHLFPSAGYYYLVLTAGSEAGLHNAKLDDIGRTDSTADTISGILTLQ
jgi:hypothetical protein